MARPSTGWKRSATSNIEVTHLLDATKLGYMRARRIKQCKRELVKVAWKFRPSASGVWA